MHIFLWTFFLLYKYGGWEGEEGRGRGFMRDFGTVRGSKGFLDGVGVGFCGGCLRV